MEGPPDLVVEVVSPSEYWVVDAEAGAVDLWRVADGTEEPDTHGLNDVLRWAPADGAATLEIDVGELLRT